MNRTLTLLIILFSVQLTKAAETNPPPPPTAPPPPGLPIDSGLLFFFFLALVIGSFLTKKYNLNK